MKSKTSFFNSTLFWNTVKRFWPIFAAYIVIWMIIMPMSLSSSLNWMSENPQQCSLSILAADQVMSNFDMITPLMGAIFSLLFVMAAFSHLYSAKSVSMMCALPMKREGVLLSTASAGLLAMLLSNVLVFLATLAVEASYGAVMMSYLWQWLALSSLCCLFFYGFASLCASFTGNLLVLPCVYLVLNFTVVVVEYFVRQILTGVYFGLSASSGIVLAKLSPLYEMIANGTAVTTYDSMGTITSLSYPIWPTVIVYGAVGVIFAVCAALLVKHRRMEAAGDVVAVNPLKPVFKYCMTLGCALVIGVIINYVIFNDAEMTVKKGFAILTVCMVFGAFVGYFASEMLIQKTLKVFSGRVWTGFGVSCLIIVALMFSCSYDIFGFERKIPDAQDVSYVSIGGNFEYVTLQEPENIAAVTQLHREIVKNKELYQSYNAVDASDPDNALFLEAEGTMLHSENVQVNITYFLKNGDVLSRNYTLYTAVKTDCVDMLSALINCGEAVQSRKEPSIRISAANINYASVYYYDKDLGDSVSLDLTPDEVVDLYDNAIVPDIEAGTLGNIWIAENVRINGKTYDETVTDCVISFELSQRVGVGNYTYDYFDTHVTLDSEKTLAWLAERGIYPILVSAEYAEKAFGNAETNYEIYEINELPAATAEEKTAG